MYSTLSGATVLDQCSSDYTLRGASELLSTSWSWSAGKGSPFGPTATDNTAPLPVQGWQLLLATC